MQSSKDSGTAALTLREDDKAKLLVAKEIHERFHAMKTYGKEPESLGSITRVMLTDLADFSPETVLLAFRTHAQRSQEFPTTADLVALIRRNGKPPLKESDIIAIRKKDGQDRSPQDWAMLREWDQMQNESWSMHNDPNRNQEIQQENVRLRSDVSDLLGQLSELKRLLAEARMARRLERPVLSTEQKVVATAKAMRDGGASEDDTIAFLQGYGLTLEDIA